MTANDGSTVIVACAYTRSSAAAIAVMMTVSLVSTSAAVSTPSSTETTASLLLVQMMSSFVATQGSTEALSVVLPPGIIVTSLRSSVIAVGAISSW